MNVSHHKPQLADLFITRRDFLSRCGMGLGMFGLANLLGPQVLGAGPAPDQATGNSPLAPRAPQFPARAKRVIHIFANGGPSHVDTFDPKPKLREYAGKMLPRPNLGTERKTGAAFPSPFQFHRHGESGLEISELFPHVAEHADDLCVIRSMH